MRPKFHALALSAVAAALLAVGHASAQTPRPEDCNAMPPDIEGPNVDVPGGQPDTDAGENLTDRLATCGSVLDPPPVGDPDVVQPAPAIDDPMSIHPSDPNQRMK